jgi:hypothetical protein
MARDAGSGSSEGQLAAVVDLGLKGDVVEVHASRFVL